jgi:hypothetical protein
MYFIHTGRGAFSWQRRIVDKAYWSYEKSKCRDE